MMYTIKKSDVGKWLGRLGEHVDVVLPGKGRDALFPGPGPAAAIKPVLLPIEELAAAGEEDRLTLMWGLRPCDARGVELLDAVFLGGAPDPLYARRREKLVFAGLVCRRRSPSCFCHVMGVDRTSSSGLDLLVMEDEENEVVFVQAVTPKGEKIMSLDDSSLGPASDKEKAAAEALLAGIRESALRERMDETQELGITGWQDVQDLKGTMEAARGSDLWTRVSDTCLGCGACSFVCPVCWCFDVRDVPRSVMEQMKGGKPPAAGKTVDSRPVRIRCADSCQLGSYGAMAGGADPLADPEGRVSHRYFHKFKYIPDEYGKVGCTGCGRCIRACPSGLDIREIILDLVEKRQ